MDVDKKENELRKKEQAKRELQDFADTIMKNVHGTERVHIGNWPRTNTRFLGNIFLNHIITDKHFRLNEEKCIKCGRCIKSCPVANMSADRNGFPQWLHTGSCLSCFACVERCPRDVEPAKLVEAVRLAVIRQQGQNHLKSEQIPEMLDDDLPQQAIVSAFRKYSK